MFIHEMYELKKRYEIAQEQASKLMNIQIVSNERKL